MDIQTMLDLETGSTAPNAAIFSIGATKFSIEDGIIDEFYATIDIKDCKKYGLHVDKKTMEWWSEQPAEAMEALLKDPVLLVPGLAKFTKWFGGRSMPVWGNGAGFDNVILGSAYRAVGEEPPSKFWHDRCYRTMKEVFNLPKPDFQGVHHNALDDARNQTGHLLSILKS